MRLLREVYPAESGARNGNNVQKVLMFLPWAQAEIPSEICLTESRSKASVLSIAVFQPSEVSFKRIG
jgi:hypothetical protein